MPAVRLCRYVLVPARGIHGQEEVIHLTRTGEGYVKKVMSRRAGGSIPPDPHFCRSHSSVIRINKSFALQLILKFIFYVPINTYSKYSTSNPTATVYEGKEKTIGGKSEGRGESNPPPCGS